MSWQAIARKDFRDSRRSYYLWGLSAVFILLITAAAYFISPAPGQTVTSGRIVGALLDVNTYFISLIALVIAHGAIVDEREGGSLKLLLSLPNSRADVVVGKVLGRSASMAAPILIAYALAAVSFVVSPVVVFKPGTYVLQVALTILLAGAFVGIAVGFSAVTASRVWAIAGAVVVYVVMVPLWIAFQFSFQMFLFFQAGNLPVDPQTLFGVLNVVNPASAYKSLMRATIRGEVFAGAGPVYTSDAFAVVMFVVWLVVPPVLGYMRFERADL